MFENQDLGAIQALTAQLEAESTLADARVVCLTEAVRVIEIQRDQLDMLRVQYQTAKNLYEVSRDKRKKLEAELKAIRAELCIEESNVGFVEAKLKQATEFSTPVFICTKSPVGLIDGKFYRMFEGNWQALSVDCTPRASTPSWTASLYKDMYQMVQAGYSFELAPEPVVYVAATISNVKYRDYYGEFQVKVGDCKWEKCTYTSVEDWNEYHPYATLVPE